MLAVGLDAVHEVLDHLLAHLVAQVGVVLQMVYRSNALNTFD